jgi:ABC-type cobalamin/Fe3+-siderophores transport system ATPase subunit
MAILTCQNLSLGYDGRQIVHDLSFEVHAGSICASSGKTAPAKAR